MLNDRVGVVLLFCSGCLIQMACANPKEVFELRIFGHSKLLVIMKSCSRIELNLLAEMICWQLVLSFKLAVRVLGEASHARASHSIGLRPKNRYCSFGAVSTIGLRPIDC